MRLGESNPTTSPLYCFSVISYLSFYRPEADKVDFIIEENGRITRYVTEFYEAMPNVLTSLGKPEHKNLLGNLIPSGKSHHSLQAADVLCWFTRRAELGLLDETDKHRYSRFARLRGLRQEFSDREIEWIYNESTKSAGGTLPTAKHKV